MHRTIYTDSLHWHSTPISELLEPQHIGDLFMGQELLVLDSKGEQYKGKRYVTAEDVADYDTAVYAMLSPAEIADQQEEQPDIESIYDAVQ